MDTKKIKQIMELFEASSVAEMSLEVEDIKIGLKKFSEVAQPISAVMPVAPIAAEVTIEDVAQAAGEAIKSPLVGTFYMAANEGATPFVEVGSTVKKGDTLCIIEAMKVMNEIKAERDGKITAVLAKNNEMVQFDDVLMYIG